MKPKFNETAVHYLEQANAQLGTCGNEACKFFISLAIENIKQQESPKYGEVINNLYEFFKDSGQSYTKLLEAAMDLQTDISRMSNDLQERRKEDDPSDLAMPFGVHEFFFLFNTLMWVLKPLAKDAERENDNFQEELERKRRQESEQQEEHEKQILEEAERIMAKKGGKA